MEDTTPPHDRPPSSQVRNPIGPTRTQNFWSGEGLASIIYSDESNRENHDNCGCENRFPSQEAGLIVDSIKLNASLQKPKGKCTVNNSWETPGIRRLANAWETESTTRLLDASSAYLTDLEVKPVKKEYHQRSQIRLACKEKNKLGNGDIISWLQDG